jgi:hypothetical protein
MLRKRGKCIIIQPKWLTIENLSKILKKEKEIETISNIHFNYIEIGLILLKVFLKK